jgi:hypothetical protein
VALFDPLDRLSKSPPQEFSPKAKINFKYFFGGMYYDFAMTPSRGHAKLNSARPLDVAVQNLRKSTLRAELGPVPFLKKDAKHLF